MSSPFVHEGEPQRLDRVLAEKLAPLTRSRVQALVKEGHASVEGRVVRDPAAKVRAGETVGLVVPAPVAATPVAQAIPLAVVYEDAELIVVDKPAGLVVHPAAGHAAGTLVNALLAHCGASLSGIGGVLRPGIVHRLDKDTSGLMVVAKTDAAHLSLAAQFADHGRTGPLERAYFALAWGEPRPPEGEIAAALARGQHDRERIVVVPEGKGRHALTRYRVVERFGPVAAPVASLVRCVLATGRTHQIRVHLAHRGHPMLGDGLYGAGFRSKASLLAPPARDALRALGRQALHAALLGFAHPSDGRIMRFESALPEDFARLADTLRATSGQVPAPR